MYGYSDSSTASARSRFTRAEVVHEAVVDPEPLPWRNGWQLVCWTAVPVEARMWARKRGDSTWPATSRRLRSFQAGSMLRKRAGVSVSWPYQPTPKPSPLVVSTPRRAWRLWSIRECSWFVEQLLEKDRGARVG